MSKLRDLSSENPCEYFDSPQLLGEEFQILKRKKEEIEVF